jgi:hypothetical protein
MKLAHDTWPLLAKMNGADSGSYQFEHGMADGLHHATNDAISTLM